MGVQYANFLGACFHLIGGDFYLFGGKFPFIWGQPIRGYLFLFLGVPFQRYGGKKSWGYVSIFLGVTLIRTLSDLGLDFGLFDIWIFSVKTEILV